MEIKNLKEIKTELMQYLNRSIIFLLTSNWKKTLTFEIINHKYFWELLLKKNYHNFVVFSSCSNFYSVSASFTSSLYS